MDALISPDAVDTRIQQVISQLGPETLPLARARGRQLSNDIRADRDLPPYDRSMMDGYAVPLGVGSWQVIARTWAGQSAEAHPLGPHEAVEVMTGAPVPATAEAVIPYEWTERRGAALIMKPGHSLTPGQFIHRQGSDHRAGEVLISAQQRLGLAEIGVAAAVGLAELELTRRPRVALLTTGDEVVPVDTASPEPHQVRQSNRALLEAMFAARGAVVASAHLDDDEAAIRAWLDEQAENADLVVAAGGMSRGHRDFLPRIFDDMGQGLFHGVAEKPGKPLGAWQLESGALALGLPGNPLAVLATATRYLLPVLEVFETGCWPQPTHLPLAKPVDARPDLAQLIPVRLEAGQAVPLRFHNSGDLAAAVGAQGVVEVAAGGTAPAQEAGVPYYPFPLH